MPPLVSILLLSRPLYAVRNDLLPVGIVTVYSDSTIAVYGDMPVVQQAKVRSTTVRQSGANDGLPSSELVYRRFKDQIISGDLAPGSRLIELNIAADFGVSRTPVREALKRLAAENLVLADPARGMIVHAPDAGEIEDVFVVREALDGLAARLAAHRITPCRSCRACSSSSTRCTRRSRPTGASRS